MEEQIRAGLAAAALQGLITQELAVHSTDIIKVNARLAVEYADAVMAELNKSQGEDIDPAGGHGLESHE